MTDNLCFAQDDGSIIIPLSVDAIKDFAENIADSAMKKKLERTISFESENQNQVILIIKCDEYFFNRDSELFEDVDTLVNIRMSAEKVIENITAT
mgnify:CR=1 FL=1